MPTNQSRTFDSSFDSDVARSHRVLGDELNESYSVALYGAASRLPAWPDLRLVYLALLADAQLLRIKHDGGVCVHRAGRGKPPFYSPHHRFCDPRNSVWLRRTPHWRRGRPAPAPNHSWVEV